MEVDGLARALERCLPVDDVDAMDDVGNAEVRVPSLADEEKLSLQRTIAAAAARNLPRLDSSNAAQYVAPPLGKLRGKKKLAERNGDDGEPAIWYWQVTGARWDRDGGTSWNSAHVAWSRLCESKGKANVRRESDRVRHRDKYEAEQQQLQERMREAEVQEVQAHGMRMDAMKRASTAKRSGCRAAPKGSGHVWLGEDGEPLDCRCSKEMGGPHATGGECALALYVYSSTASMLFTRRRWRQPDIDRLREECELPYEAAQVACLQEWVDKANAVELTEEANEASKRKLSVLTRRRNEVFTDLVDIVRPNQFLTFEHEEMCHEQLAFLSRLIVRFKYALDFEEACTSVASKQIRHFSTTRPTIYNDVPEHNMNLLYEWRRLVHLLRA
jgi:hypothetical protein